MRLEAIPKYFSPKSLHISDSPCATHSDMLTGTDIMTGLGMTQSKAGFGLSLFLAKTEISKEDKKRAIELLTQFAIKKAPKHVGKAAGRKMALCMMILAKMAYEEYSNSASKVKPCKCCDGTGFIDDTEDVVKESFYIGEITKKKEYYLHEPKTEKIKKLCKACNGKGIVSNRCRCNGTGKVINREKTKELGAPVIELCDRCEGRGFKRTPSSVVYRAVKVLLPDLTQPIWSRHWKRLYEQLIQECLQQESTADSIFKNITK